jgi:hypothetical protein
MVWIKRNLIFVISMAVGLLLTGYCGYLLYSSLDANSGVSANYLSTLNNLQMMQQKSPSPTKENIQLAKDDQARARKFLADARKRFAPFPTPSFEDEKGFHTRLGESLATFRTEATNAGVQLPAADFPFGFPGLMEKFNYPRGNIAPWLQQLEEISAILDILYGAKINSLVDLQRGAVSSEDSGAGLPAANVTNQWGISSPYKMKFQSFSGELAAVIEGFAQASNCFIIKDISVESTEKSVQQNAVQSFQEQPVSGSSMRSQYVNPMRPRPRPERGVPGGIPAARPTPTPRVAVRPAAPAAVAMSSASAVKILSESSLVVTLSVDVIKLKASEH